MTGTASDSTALAEIVQKDICPLIAVNVDNLFIVAVSAACYELLGRQPHSLENVPITDVVINFDRSSMKDLVKVLRSGALTGYRAVRQLRKADGSEFTATIRVRLARTQKRIGLLTIEGGEGRAALSLVGSNIDVALAVTNHDWVIEREHRYRCHSWTEPRKLQRIGTFGTSAS